MGGLFLFLFFLNKTPVKVTSVYSVLYKDHLITHIFKLLSELNMYVKRGVFEEKYLKAEKVTAGD